jgi:hypothetical protein
MSALSTLVGTAKRARRRAHGKQLTAVAQGAMPAKPDKGVRKSGPYPEKGKWRIYLIDDSGRKAFLYASRDEAEQMKAKLTEHERRSASSSGQSVSVSTRITTTA